MLQFKWFGLPAACTFFILACSVRSNYTPDALNTAMPHLADTGLLMSMQNGINPPLLQEKVGADRTVGMAIRMGSRKVAAGHLHTATRGHLYIGHPHGRTTPQLQELNQLLNSVMETEISDNILGVLWSKLTYTCLGYYGSLADASLTTTCVTEADRKTLANFFAEVVGIGTAEGVCWIPLSEYNPPDFHPSNSLEKRVAAVNEFAKSWKADDRKGPLRQIQKRIKTEVDFTLAYVIQQGKRHGIQTPLCEKVLDMIHGLEAGTRRLGAENYAELRSLGDRKS